MAGVLQVLLHIDGGIAEGRLRFLARHRHCVEQCRFGVDDAHAASAATARGLDDDRVADRSRRPHDLARILRERALRSRHRRNRSGRHRLLRRDLVPHQADRFRPRPDEDKAALFDALGEVGVFRQKAVARMNRFRIGHFGGADDRRDVEVALARRRRTDAHRFVGELHVLGVGVGLRVHDHGADAQLAACALDAQRDLPAVGDQDFLEHVAPQRQAPDARARRSAARGIARGRRKSGAIAAIRSGRAAGHTRPAARCRRGSWSRSRRLLPRSHSAVSSLR